MYGVFMKMKVILPAVSDPRISVPALGLGTLMAALDASDEIVVTAEQAQQAAMWEESDVVVVTVGPDPERALNLGELYRIAGAHVVLIGPGLVYLADSTKKRQTVFVGAAEELWAAFLRDFRRGTPGHCYAAEFRLRELGMFGEAVSA